MNDFWETYGNSYAAFSQHCDNADWRIILLAISEEIINLSKETPLKILDIGSGYGKNIEEILEYVLSKTNKVSVLDIIENSNKAVNVAKTLLLPYEKGGFLRNIFAAISDIKNNKYDVIIFMHSSYYIAEISNLIEKIYHNNLEETGKIIILSLPSTSSFFLNEKNLILKNTSDMLQNEFADKKMSFDIKEFNSRFHVSRNGHIDTGSFVFLYEFMTQGKIPILDFQNKLLRYAEAGNLNFRDEMLIINKSNNDKGKRNQYKVR